MTTAPSWLAIRLLDRDLLPDRLIRAGIRSIVAARLREQAEPSPARLAARRRRFVEARSTGPIADTAAASARPCEVPPEFYRWVLGPHLKYSSAFWDPGVDALAVAEARMLALTAERARLVDGQRILELGCGWGALALWMARRFPASRITAVSNSRAQKAWIDERARLEGLTNLEVITADMNVFEARGRYDRIVSVEMLEHMRNWRALLGNIRRWLDDDGRVFIHMFTHRRDAYAYEARDESDWMARYFFTGGIMPADDLLYEFADLLTVVDRWSMSGTHYQRTADAWLANLDAHRADAWPLLERAYGSRHARRWWVRWRVFFMACAELWGYRQGEEWIVSHYLLEKT